MPRRFFVWGAVLALFLDQVTKVMVYGFIRPGESVRVIDNILRLVHTDNPQGVFGLSFGLPILYYILPSVGAVLVLWFGLRVRERWSAAAYGFILGGAVGNLADRVRLGGRVIDFIDVGWRGWHWYTFNIADGAVVVGVIMLLAREFLWRRPAGDRTEPPTTMAEGKPDEASLPR
jgi:signal peptidase II